MIPVQFLSWFTAALVVFAWLFLPPDNVGADGPEKWFYAYINLHRDAEGGGDGIAYGVNDFLDDVLPQLKEHGYNAIVLSNFHLCDKKKLTKDDSKLVQNLKVLVEACADEGIEIIPEIMTVGGSAPILLNDPNLAEGTPVRDMEFVVKKAPDETLFAEVKSQQNLIPHGEFNADLETIEQSLGIHYGEEIEVSTEGTIGNLDDPDMHLVIRQDPGSEDAGSLYLEAKGIQLKRFHQYRLSFKIKTEHFNAETMYALVRARFDNDYRRLEQNLHKIETTQSWTTYVVSFNSLQATEAEFQLGLEGIDKGTFRFENLILQESGGVNLLRREDLPVVIKRAGDGHPLHSKDVKAWKDPDLGYYPGFYDHDESPALLKITHDDQIQEGDTLLVSYFHAAIAEDNGYRVCCSMTNEDVDEILTMQIRELNRIMDAKKPQRWVIFHDEIRVAGYEPSAAGKTPGKLLGEMLSRGVDIIKRESPGSHMILISDMYDPFHNAVRWNDEEQSYHPMVNGSFRGSWDAIPRDGSVSIWNWNLGETQPDDMTRGMGNVRASFGFFDDLELVQTVGGFYDVFDRKAAPDVQTREVRRRTEQNFVAAKENGKIMAVCYYTAYRNHQFLEVFAQVADAVWPPR